MKVAVLIDVLYPYMIGGGQKRYYEVYKRLSGKHDIHFFSMRWPDMPKKNFKTDGITVHPVCEGSSEIYAGKRRKMGPAIRYSLALVPHLIQERFDVIDCNEFPFLHIPIAKVFGRCKKLVVNWHEVWRFKYWKDYCGKLFGSLGYTIQWMCSRIANKIIAVSGHTRDQLNIMLGVKMEKIETVPNGIDIKMINNVKPHKKKYDVIFVGRLIAEKNVDVLLKAVALTKKKVKCVIIGEGPEKEHLIELSNELGISKRVDFLGFLPRHEDVLSYMKSSRVVVSPSIREGFGLVIIEAMACGLPIIAVRHPDSAVPSVLKGRGRLVELDAEEMGNAIASELKKGKQRKYELDEYLWNNIAKDFEKAIQIEE